MQVTDKFNLLPPGICIICEGAPDGEVIDTLYTTKTGVASYLNGRKYVCDRCVGAFAKLLGYEKGEHVKQSQIDVEFAEHQLANFRALVKDFATFVAKVAEHPGAASEDVEVVFTSAAIPALTAPKPEVKDVYPEVPVHPGGTTKGVDTPDDSEAPAVPSQAVAEAGVDPDTREDSHEPVGVEPDKPKATKAKKSD